MKNINHEPLGVIVPFDSFSQWIGLRDNLQENFIFHGKKNQWFPVKISLKPIQSSNDSRAFAYHFSWSFLILPPSFLHLQLGKAPGAQSHLGDQSPWIFEHAGELQGKPQCLQCLYMFILII